VGVFFRTQCIFARRVSLPRRSNYSSLETGATMFTEKSTDLTQLIFTLVRAVRGLHA